MKAYILERAILMPIGALAILFFLGCKKNINDNNEIVSYYVKYNIKGNGTYGRFSDWTATIPQGIYSNNGYQERNWSQTYGPLNKGFKCEVQIGNYIGGAPVIEIHVSKNSEPFALKVSRTGNAASYIIDF